MQEVYERNYKILKPFELDDLSPEEHSLFLKQWTNKQYIQAIDLTFEALGEFNFSLQVSPQMKQFYKLG